TPHRVVGVDPGRVSAVHRRVGDLLARDEAFFRIRVTERAGRVGDRADAAFAVRARVVAERLRLAACADGRQAADVVVAVTGGEVVGARHQVPEARGRVAVVCRSTV